MRKTVFMVFLFLSFVSCKGQDKDNKGDFNAQTNTEKGTKQEPKGKWEVHKELDENGNIIGYDSIYSWSSTGNYDDFSSINVDSLMRSHQSFVKKRFSAMRDNDFSYLFEQDSLFPKSFFEEDMFMNQFGEDFPEFETMRRRMQQMQDEMMKEFFPSESSNKNNKKSKD